jgi:hypothetical protein
MQREAGVWAGKPVGSGLSTTFTPMSDKPPLGLRPRWLVLSDRADEIKAAIQRYETLGLPRPFDWLIELQESAHILIKLCIAVAVLLTQASMQTDGLKSNRAIGAANGILMRLHYEP